ncbi:hypothetical protein [Phenylobacterium sp.]|uniref:hypothetical protein n=1 Tax=Phenylobacterium sp. TaxID=1871053 RepID=UPI0025F7AB2A|nr:hypothetical protein [Phenylobacterium sp.]
MKNGQRVIVRLSDKAVQTPGKSGTEYWGGDDNEVPRQLLDHISVTVGASPAIVPYSAFADLGDVRFASLVATGTGFELKISGGDTASSYEARLIFRDGFLIEKIVRLLEMPDERNEIAKYNFPRR